MKLRDQMTELFNRFGDVEVVTRDMLVAQMVRSVVAPSAISEPREWTASYAGAGAAPRKTAFRSTCVFDESPNGRGGINEVFSGDDPFGEFL